MELIKQFEETFYSTIDSVAEYFSMAFQYLLSIGVRQETLILILIGGGVSLLILIAAIIMTIFRMTTNRSKKPKKTTRTKTKKPTKGAPQNPEMTPIQPQDEPAEVTSTSASESMGFAIFKKNKPHTATKNSPNDSTGQGGAGQLVMQLADIERDMLALKELYEAGHITADVYVSESKELYEKAKALAPKP